MATVPSGATAQQFGREPIPPDLLRMCRSLRPVPRALADGAADSELDVAVLSEELLLEAAVAGRTDCVYAFCRLNAEAVRRMVLAKVSSDALPLAVDGLAAEILAEIADAARFVVPSRVGELYGSIPSVAANVIGQAVDETLGFVPTLADRNGRSSLAGALAERIDLPRELVANVATLVDAATTRIVAAQALLQLSPQDRALLLATTLPPTERPSARAVASLLSEKAAQRRFGDEFERITRWLRRALDAGDAGEPSGEDAA